MPAAIASFASGKAVNTVAYQAQSLQNDSAIILYYAFPRYFWIVIHFAINPAFYTTYVIKCSNQHQLSGSCVRLIIKMLAQSFCDYQEKKMALSANSDAVTYAKAANTRTAAETGDRIEWVKLSLAFLPLATPVSDAKVLTGRQKPLTEVAIIIAEIRSRDGFEGVGFSYSKRAGGGVFMLTPKR